MVDYTHEIVLDKEARESSLKMIIKAWPKETTYYDRLRVTDWLIEKAATKNQVTQEHGYYTSGKKYVLSPVSILTFANQDDQQCFEKYSYTTFSGRWPLYYWDSSGNYVQHWRGGWHRLVVTNYISKTDLTINLALTTALHILTSHTESPFTGADFLSHRPTDKHIFNLKDKKVIAKAIYDRDRGTVTIITQKDLIEIIKDNWHDSWKEAQKDHPRFANYYRYPYAVTFAAARLDEDHELQKMKEWLHTKQTHKQKNRQQFRQQLCRGPRASAHPARKKDANSGHLAKTRAHRPSRRHPGTRPIGLTNLTRSRKHNTAIQKEFFYQRRNSVRIHRKRALKRRAWRFFKRTQLRERATKIAKRFLRQSTLQKKKLLSKTFNRKIKKKCILWLRSNREKIRNHFRTFYATICKRTSPNHPLDPKESKDFAFKSNHKLHMATLNVRGLNKLTKRDMIDNIMKRNNFDIFYLRRQM